MSEIAKFLPSNTQLLARRQHAELEELRGLNTALQQQVQGLEAVLAEAEAEHAGLQRDCLQLLAARLRADKERDRALQMLGAMLRADIGPVILAALGGGFLAVFAIRLWGW